MIGGLQARPGWFKQIPCCYIVQHCLEAKKEIMFNKVLQPLPLHEPYKYKSASCRCTAITQSKNNEMKSNIEKPVTEINRLPCDLIYTLVDIHILCTIA